MPLKRAAFRDHRLLFFIWLLFSINLMSGTGYWFASGIANTGDWAIVIRGWQPRWAFQIGLVVLGAAALMAGVGWALVEFGRLVGTHGEKPIRRAQGIAMTCYAAAFVVMLVIGSAQPGGPFAFPGINGLVAVLGGLSPLLWMMQWFRAEMFKRRGTSPLQIQRSVSSAVVAGAAVMLAVIVTLVGQQ